MAKVVIVKDADMQEMRDNYQAMSDRLTQIETSVVGATLNGTQKALQDHAVITRRLLKMQGKDMGL